MPFALQAEQLGAHMSEPRFGDCRPFWKMGCLSHDEPTKGNAMTLLPSITSHSLIRYSAGMQCRPDLRRNTCSPPSIGISGQ